MDYQVKSKVARCQSEFLKIHQGKDFAKFCRFTKTSSAREQATWAELGRALAEAAEVTSGVVNVIGNLLVFGQALRA
jgi:hypothetical protein